MADESFIILSGCESSTMMASSLLWPISGSCYQVSIDSLIARMNEQPSDEEIRELADYCDGTLRALSERCVL